MTIQTTYKVTIKQEKSLLVARDEQGNRRTYGPAETYSATKHGDLAHYLFHADEIETSETQPDGSCVAQIREW